MKNKVSGFTLIELVVVIVLIGILAITAAPKFINLSRDAVIGNLEGMAGALRSGAKLVYAKAIIANLDSDKQEITIDNSTVRIYGGYPQANWDFALRYVVNLADVDHVLDINIAVDCTLDWCGKGNSTQAPGVNISGNDRVAKVTPKGYSWNDECAVYYINHMDNSAPVIGLTTTDC